MSDAKIYQVPAEIAATAHLSQAKYEQMYNRSVNEPEVFWSEQANEFVSWSQPWDQVMEEDFPKGYIRWFKGAQLNVLMQFPITDFFIDLRVVAFPNNGCLISPRVQVSIQTVIADV